MRVEKKPPRISIAVFRKSYPYENLDEELLGKNIAVTRIPLVRFAKIRESEATLREYLKLQLALLEKFGSKDRGVEEKPPVKIPTTIIWLFTSQQAVYRSMEVMNKWMRMKLKGDGISKPKNFLQELFNNSKLRNRIKLVAVGRSTQRLIKNFGLRVDYSVDENPGERTGLVGQQAVFQLLKKSATGQKNTAVQVVHPSAKKIDNYLAKNLKKTVGIHYRSIPLYETVSLSMSTTAGKKLWESDYWFITSPSIAKNLFTELGKIIPATKYEKLPRLIVIGKTTQKALKEVLKRVKTKKLQTIGKELVHNAKTLAGNFSEDTARRIIKTTTTR